MLTVLLTVVGLLTTRSTSANSANSANQTPAAQWPTVDAGHYFVSFHDGVNNNNKAFVKALGATIHHEFPEVKAISVKLNSPAILAALQNSPLVDYVEEVPMR